MNCTDRIVKKICIVVAVVVLFLGISLISLDVKADGEKTISDLQTAIDAVEQGGTFVLTEDYVTGPALNIAAGKKITIDLNGHKIDRALTNGVRKGWVIYVAGDLTIKDSTGNNGMITGGNNDYTGSVRTDVGCGVKVYGNGSKFTFESGKICGNKSKNYGGVYASDLAIFIMTGGEITGNTAAIDSAGFVVYNTTLVMTGGKVYQNTNENTKANSYGAYASGNGLITIGGDAYIGENKNLNGDILNLHVGSQMKISPGLTSNAYIGIAPSNPSGAQLVANGSDPGDGSAFHADNSDYAIAKKSNSALCYVKKTDIVTITTEPGDAHAAVGDDISFSVVCSSSTAMSYVWYCDDGSGFQEMSGETSSSISVTVDESNLFYRYKCKITNATGYFAETRVAYTADEPDPVHVHSFEWKAEKKVTRFEDGIECEICSCGEKRESRTVSAFYYALFGYAYEMIENASEGDTLTFDFYIWNSFPKEFMERIAEKSAQGITFIFNFNHDDSLCRVVIPAGTVVDTGIDWYGPLKMAELYGIERTGDPVHIVGELIY